MNTQGITLRFGAAHNSVTVGAVIVDLSKATKTERYEARKAIIEGLKQKGYFGTKEKRKALFRARRDAAHG